MKILTYELEPFDELDEPDDEDDVKELARSPAGVTFDSESLEFWYTSPLSMRSIREVVIQPFAFIAA